MVFERLNPSSFEDYFGSCSEWRDCLIGLPVMGSLVSSLVLSMIASFFFYFFSFARISCLFSRSIILSIDLLSLANFSM